MFLEEAVVVIHKRWLSMWPMLSGDVPTIVENLTVPVPTVLDNEAEDEYTAFCVLSIKSLPTMPQTMGAKGNRRVQRNGLVSVKISVPADQGRALADRYVKHVQTIFEGESIGGSSTDDGVKLYYADPREVGSDGQFFVMLVTIPFSFWAIR